MSYIPRINEFIFIKDVYYNVINVIYDLNNKEKIIIVVKKIDKL